MKNVSVIIPVFNTSKYLKECLNSVIEQTLTDIEIIIVNDGSTDNSQEIINKFQASDSRIISIEKKNKGVASARNSGLDRASGEYIYFFDSDDIMAPNFLEAHFKTAKEMNADVVFTDRRVIEDCSYEELGAFATFGGFIKNEFLLKHPDIRFPDGIQPCEDGIFSHKLLALDPNLAKSFDTWYYYRQHSGQNSRNIKTNLNKLITDIPIWLDILKEFYDKNDLWDKKALLFAHFIHHEPFYARMCLIPTYHIAERKKLYNIIKNFYNTYLKNKISKKEYETLGFQFKRMLNSKSFFRYEIKNMLLNNNHFNKLFMKLKQ